MHSLTYIKLLWTHLSNRVGSRFSVLQQAIIKRSIDRFVSKYFDHTFVCSGLSLISLSSVQKWGGDDVLDFQNKPGRSAIFCTSFSCRYRLNEEILSTHSAVFVYEAQSGTPTEEQRCIWNVVNWFMSYSESRLHGNWKNQTNHKKDVIFCKQTAITESLSSIRHLYIFYLCPLALRVITNNWTILSFFVCDWLRRISCVVMRASWSRWAWSWRSTATALLKLTPKAVSGRSSDLKNTTLLMRYGLVLSIHQSIVQYNVWNELNIGALSTP